MVEEPEIIDGHRVLEVVGRGACGVVYKVEAPDSGGVKALKLLSSSLPDTLIDKLRFEREFRLASACDHRFLVKALVYGHFQGRPYYTMDLIDGRNFRDRFRDLSTSGEREAFARVVEGLLEALSHIHDKSIVHRDLKPENVLVNGLNEPRILDFGLARPQYGDDSTQLTVPGTVVGTVHYLSPEQLSTRPLDGRADLFSLGSMIYEVLAGRCPFEAEHTIGIFGQILAQPVPPLNLSNDFPKELSSFVLKLLEKEPHDRYQTAAEALVDWRRIMFGVEQAAVSRNIQRPEQLYMPRFVGQSRAVSALQKMQKGEGPRVLLVAGVSGAGKSRFLEECSARVKAGGEPQSGARAGGQDANPYQIWIPTLRQAFKRPPPALMPLRTVLSPLMPELGFHKGGASSKSQLFGAMAKALRLHGGLIWVDDIHLGDSASLEFFHYLARSLGPADKLMIVATYNPTDGMKFVRRTRDALLGAEFAVDCELQPLSEQETQVMVGSMLGGTLSTEGARTIHRETGGNPLYTSEVVKAALADEQIRFENGQWVLGEASDRSVPGSVKLQLETQLQSIEQTDVEVLKLAALIGFDFNFEILSQATEIPKMELLERILRVSDKGFLIESEQDCFRFGSRALHEMLLELTPAEQRPALHLRVAEALEKLMPRQRWVMDIARQYEAAGQPGKAATHLLAAGAEASRNFAFKDALAIYKRTLEVPVEERSLTDEVILEKIADAQKGVGQYQASKAGYEALLAKALATITQVRLRRKIAECEQTLGDFAGAYQHLSEGLSLLGVGGGDQKAAPKGASPLSWVKKHFSKLSGSFSSDDVMSQEIHHILDRQISTLFFLRPEGWKKQVAELAGLQRNVAKKLNNPQALAQAQVFLGFVELSQGRRDSALLFWKKGIEITETLRDGPYKSLLLRNTGLMHLLAGEAATARALCQKTLLISERLSDRPGLTQVHMVLCAIELHWAHFDKALEHARAMLATADDAGLPVFRALGWSYMARATARNDFVREAEAHLAKAIEMARELKLPYVDMMVGLARAWVFCDLGSYEPCLKAVEGGMELCQRVDALPFYRLTLRCAGLWASVDWVTRGQPPASVSEGLVDRLKEFQRESVEHGVVQFESIAAELLARLTNAVH